MLHRLYCADNTTVRKLRYGIMLFCVHSMRKCFLTQQVKLGNLKDIQRGVEGGLGGHTKGGEGGGEHNEGGKKREIMLTRMAGEYRLRENGRSVT